MDIYKFIYGSAVNFEVNRIANKSRLEYLAHIREKQVNLEDFQSSKRIRLAIFETRCWN